MSILLEAKNVPSHLQKYFQKPRACGQCYICHLMAIMGELYRVLRDDGTAWIVIADSFAQARGHGHWESRNGKGDELGQKATKQWAQRGAEDIGLKPKSLLLIPQRFTLACQAAGWVVRSVPSWIKSSVLPEPVRDRPSVSHETVILLAKGPHYYFDADAVKQPVSQATASDHRTGRRRWQNGGGSPESLSAAVRQGSGVMRYDTSGRNRRTGDWWLESLDQVITDTEAWLAHAKQVRAHGGLLLSPEAEPLGFSVNPQPSSVAHYAGFPEALIRPMILASTSAYGACPCGAPWRRLVHCTRLVISPGPSSHRGAASAAYNPSAGGALRSDGATHTQTLGWTPTCTCHQRTTAEGYAYCPLPKPEVVPCTVLDPFVGSGTTPFVGRQLGRKTIAIDLSESYCDLTMKRLNAVLPLFDEPSQHGHQSTQEVMSFDA